KINLSLNEECYGVILASRMLQGGPYSCLEDFVVTAFDKDGNPIGDTITSEYIGQTLITEVLAPNGNKCWGEVFVEDKRPAILDCQPAYTTCKGNTEPGSPLPHIIPFKADLSMP